MKKFLKTFFVFMIPFFIIAGYVESRLQFYPSPFRIKSKHIKANQKNIEILILGSSHHQAGINPVYFSTENVSNLAYGYQDVGLDLKLLEKYINRLPKLKFVVLELGYHTLETSIGPESERNILYLRFYGINNFIRPLAFSDYSIFLSNPRLYLQYLNPFSKPLVFNKFGAPDSLSAYPKDLCRFNNLKYDSAIINGDINNLYITRHKVEDLKAYATNKVIFEKMLRLCVERDIIPVISIAPVYKSYYEAMIPAKKQRRDDFLNYCLNKYPSIRLLNQEEGRGFVITDFLDDDHLEPRGARKYTMMLDSLIRSSKAEIAH